MHFSCPSRLWGVVLFAALCGASHGVDRAKVLARLASAPNAVSAEDVVRGEIGKSVSSVNYFLERLWPEDLEHLPLHSLAELLKASDDPRFQIRTFPFDPRIDELTLNKWKQAIVQAQLWRGYRRARLALVFRKERLSHLMSDSVDIFTWMRDEEVPLSPEIGNLLFQSFHTATVLSGVYQDIERYSREFMLLVDALIELFHLEPASQDANDIAVSYSRGALESCALDSYQQMGALKREWSKRPEGGIQLAAIDDRANRLTNQLRGYPLSADEDWSTEEGLARMFPNSLVFDPSPVEKELRKRLGLMLQSVRKEPYRGWSSPGVIGTLAAVSTSLFSASASLFYFDEVTPGLLATGPLAGIAVYLSRDDHRRTSHEQVRLATMLGMGKLFESAREEPFYITNSFATYLADSVLSLLTFEKGESSLIREHSLRAIESYLDWYSEIPEVEEAARKTLVGAADSIRERLQSEKEFSPATVESTRIALIQHIQGLSEQERQRSSGGLDWNRPVEDGGEQRKSRGVLFHRVSYRLNTAENARVVIQVEPGNISKVMFALPAKLFETARGLRSKELVKFLFDQLNRPGIWVERHLLHDVFMFYAWDEIPESFDLKTLGGISVWYMPWSSDRLLIENYELTDTRTKVDVHELARLRSSFKWVEAPSMKQLQFEMGSSDNLPAVVADGLKAVVVKPDPPLPPFRVRVVNKAHRTCSMMIGAVGNAVEAGSAYGRRLLGIRN